MGDDATLETRTHGAWTVVDVAGELDLASAPALASALEPLAAVPAARIVVDLTDVSFMDSSGLGVVLDAHNEVTGNGGRMSLVVAAGPVARLLELTGVTDQLDVHDSVDAATE